MGARAHILAAAWAAVVLVSLVSVRGDALDDLDFELSDKDLAFLHDDTAGLTLGDMVHDILDTHEDAFSAMDAKHITTTLLQTGGDDMPTQLEMSDVEDQNENDLKALFQLMKTMMARLEAKKKRLQQALDATQNRGKDTLSHMLKLRDMIMELAKKDTTAAMNESKDGASGTNDSAAAPAQPQASAPTK